MSVYPVIMSDDQFINYDELFYPYEERGLQFGDGVYEVVRIYNGQYYLLQEHIERFYKSSNEIKINLPYEFLELKNLLIDLLEKNDMKNDGILYIQATRGSAPRNHLFPKNSKPNIYAYIKDFTFNIDKAKNGVSTITLPDTRWKNCHIKSLNLLPNVLAKQEANEKGCHEAVLYTENGTVTECSSSNIYLVKSGRIYTHSANNRILHGCVRIAIEQFAKNMNIPFIEQSFSLDEINDADELFSTSSTSEVTPIIKMDNIQIGNGRPGSITQKLQEAYYDEANIKSIKNLVFQKQHQNF